MKMFFLSFQVMLLMRWESKMEIELIKVVNLVGVAAATEGIASHDFYVVDF